MHRSTMQTLFMADKNSHSDASCHFFGAAHLDRLGRFNEMPIGGKSNPGVFAEHVGGAAINAARIYANMGGHAALTTILGRDSSSNAVEREASRHGIFLDAQSGERTATYTVFIEPDGNANVALADMEIYDQFQTPKKPANAEWVFIDANLPPIVITELTQTNPGKVCLTTVSPAKANRIKSALPHADLLITNKQEAATLLGMSDNFDNEKSPQAFDGHGIADVVVTNGPHSVLVFANGQLEEVTVPSGSTVRDVTGAGDAFAGAVLYALSNGLSLSQATKVGIEASGMVVQVDGPWQDNLKPLLKNLGNSFA